MILHNTIIFKKQDQKKFSFENFNVNLCFCFMNTNCTLCTT